MYAMKIVDKPLITVSECTVMKLSSNLHDEKSPLVNKLLTICQQL